jgi:coenzyme PQQ synthesis protein D (PqqD)
MKQTTKPEVHAKTEGIQDETVVVAVKNHVSSLLGQEAVILHLGKGEYYGLNEVGAVIWKLLEKPTTAAKIAAEITGKFEVTSKQSISDVLRLLKRMREAKLIEIVARGAQR